MSFAAPGAMIGARRKAAGLRSPPGLAKRFLLRFGPVAPVSGPSFLGEEAPVKVWEYEGFSPEEAETLWEKSARVRFEELPDDGPIPLALIDLAPGRPSEQDILELRRFGAYLAMTKEQR